MAKIGFVGCHEISWFCLKKICQLSKEHKDEIVVVYNLNEEESKKHSSYFNFDSLKKEFDFNLKYISNITDRDNLEFLKNSGLDVLFIIGWHKIVPQAVIDTAKICLGIHSSELPRDRGSSPINWQIIKAEEKGGVTLFHLSEGVDSGPIVESTSYDISDEDDVRTVYFKATIASISLLEKHWSNIHNLDVPSITQDESQATYNERRRPKDGLIDWTQSSKKCYDWIRAITFPYPGAYTYWNKKKIILISSKISNIQGTKPGEILQVGEKIIVSSGDNSLEILSLQVEGEPICNAKLFVDSYKIQSGDVFSNS
jgi:methionyl-tRNA formyltransferase